MGATQDLPAPTKSVGYLRLAVQTGTPGAPDDSDVRVTFSLTNVMYAADFSDYPARSRVRVPVRVTDKEQDDCPAPCIQDFKFRFTVQCSPTADSTIGSTCAAQTTLNNLVPGAIGDARRAVLGLGQIEVHDGGNDGDADTGQNFLFATQGLFVP